MTLKITIKDTLVTDLPVVILTNALKPMKLALSIMLLMPFTIQTHARLKLFVPILKDLIIVPVMMDFTVTVGIVLTETNVVTFLSA